MKFFQDKENVAYITLKYLIKLGKYNLKMVIKLLRAHGECLGTRS